MAENGVGSKSEIFRFLKVFWNDFQSQYILITVAGVYSPLVSLVHREKADVSENTSNVI